MRGLITGMMERWARAFSKRAKTKAAAERQIHEPETLAFILSSHPNYRVLRALDRHAGADELGQIGPGERVGVVVDTETTGLDLANDSIFEIAIQRFVFDRQQRITKIERPRSWLEDPGQPLPQRIARLTGVFEEALSGQAFDEEGIVALLRSADFVIAHNAAFDRPFLERRFTQLGNLSWACSLSQLDWQDLGFDGRALGHLLLQSGWFFEGHRASNDTNALTTLLSETAKDGRTILAHLIERCERESVRIDAVGAPFEAKEALRSRGYRWDPARRFWWREVELTEQADEVAWLQDAVYQGKGGPAFSRLTSQTRFKSNRAS